MSNDTQVAAHMALVKKLMTLAHPIDKYEAAEVFAAVEASARQLAEQGARPLTTRELADVTAPWAHIWTDQSFGIANAAIAKFCEVNGIAARPLTASPTAPSTEASEPAEVLRSNDEGRTIEFDAPVYIPPGCSLAIIATPPPAPVLSDAEPDPLLNEALKLCVEKGYTSVSYVQRKLNIGYNRACELVATINKRGLFEQAIGRASRGAK